MRLENSPETSRWRTGGLSPVLKLSTVGNDNSSLTPGSSIPSVAGKKRLPTISCASAGVSGKSTAAKPHRPACVERIDMDNSANVDVQQKRRLVNGSEFRPVAAARLRTHSGPRQPRETSACHRARAPVGLAVENHNYRGFSRIERHTDPRGMADRTAPVTGSMVGALIARGSRLGGNAEADVSHSAPVSPAVRSFEDPVARIRGNDPCLSQYLGPSTQDVLHQLRPSRLR